MQFQKISIPTPWKVNGNSEGVGGGLESQNFKRNVWGLTEMCRAVGDSNQKTFRRRGMDIFWNNTFQKLASLFAFESILQTLATFQSRQNVFDNLQ